MNVANLNRTKKVQDPVMVCVTGRQEMSREQKEAHFRTCSHPQCVALLALYDQIAKHVQEQIKKPWKHQPHRHGV